MVVYDPIRVRCELPRAADWLLDGTGAAIDRDELIQLITATDVGAAAALIAEAGFYRGDGDVAIVALALVIERELDWVGLVADTLRTIARNFVA